MEQSPQKIGVFEAKTHLSELLERVAAGEHFVITRRGQPIARLVPAADPGRMQVQDAARELSTFSRGRRLGEGGWKALRDEGRKW